MRQNLVSISISNEVQAQVLGLVAEINRLLPELIAFEPGERRSYPMLGPASEAFGRGVLVAMHQNTDIVPRGIDLATAAADLAALDQITPILAAMQQLTERLEDTKAALGSDVMAVANMGYGLMKSVGRGEGLDASLKELSYRYRKKQKPKPGEA